MADASNTNTAERTWAARVIGTTRDRTGGERQVAEVYAWGGELIVDATYVEDAILIAAAPSLLAIAENIDSFLRSKGLSCECGQPHCRTTLLRAAIAAAQVK